MAFSIVIKRRVSNTVNIMVSFICDAIDQKQLAFKWIRFFFFSLSLYSSVIEFGFILMLLGLFVLSCRQLYRMNYMIADQSRHNQTNRTEPKTIEHRFRYIYFVWPQTDDRSCRDRL